ncbi:MAG TPA: tetratricopeptide repeat protein, partial [Bryobacteraceae bacterium]|nr:tetratricopeptide repeat protein [Bryobacteraceae bacterium]
AQNGLGCMSCHSIVHVDSSMGNGGLTIAYPPLHELASSKNPYIKAMDHFLTYLNPEPHRNTFMKPFMRQDSAEFCSTCHKVHLDVPVNNYRWQRGFNDYDNWQASGVSGQGARSFYYPAKSMACVDCHMPEVKSNDPGNKGGLIHSHRFPAANMAVAYANRDAEQMREEEKFLTSGFITVDIFAASPVDNSPSPLEMRRRTNAGPQLMSTFAIGEEAEQQGPVLIREVGKVAAPIDAAGVKFQPGSTVRLDTVVRTRKIGHFFPGGTVDSFDTWLEVQARDANGRIIFWNGRVEDDGRGPVEPGAHFYRSYLLDAEGNEINKRNAFQARSVLYVRLIPPGAADVAHYLLRIPKDAVGPISVSAKLNYRKFSHYYTQFSYAGEPLAGQAPELVSVNFDNRRFSFDRANIPANVSGKIRAEIPNVPIVTLAKAETKLALGGDVQWQPVVRKQDRERWNDWGIGLLLQGDLKGAEYAFRKVTEAEPGYADGWLNVARALIQEGETDAAKPFVEKATAIDSSLGRVWFFRAMIQKTDGDYDGALSSLRKVNSQYPRDRVALNQIGRILFLQRKYADAVVAFEKCLQVDPEDVQAHYNLMLCYRGLGESDKARREEALFQRFKADESAQTITAKPRQLSAEANNERQPIHDHESVLVKP